MKVLGWITWFVAAVLVGSLLEAWALQRLWTWFCATQYGAGPSMGTWFGLASIKGVLFSRSRQSIGTEVQALGAVVKECLTAWVFVLLGLGVAWGIGLVTGWGA